MIKNWAKKLNKEFNISLHFEHKIPNMDSNTVAVALIKEHEGGWLDYQ